MPIPSQWFFLKKFEQSEGLSKFVEFIKYTIKIKLKINIKKYIIEKELKIPIKIRKVISNK